MGRPSNRDDDVAARSLDFEKTAMQDKGFCSAIRLTVAEAVEIVTDLGIDPAEVVYANGCLTTKEALSHV
jgi:acyl CoA:acetate/3-ketoacid CoA transferase alpha subunit